MLLITSLGEETAFLAVAIITYWCLDKNRGYYLMTVGFIGTIFNQFLKLLCRIPRPWVKDPNFTIVEEAREAASGYSFPSGHSQSAVGTFGGLAATVSNKALRILFIVIAVLVPFSRMYLGVHTPADVLVGSACSVAMIFGFRFMVKGKGIPVMFGVMGALAVGFICFVEFFPFPADIDAHNYASGVSSAYKFLGAIIGFAIVYILAGQREMDTVRQPAAVNKDVFVLLIMLQYILDVGFLKVQLFFCSSNGSQKVTDPLAGQIGFRV
jgi:undecaprenyl-diphosphatase